MPLVQLAEGEYVKNAPQCPLWQSLEWKRYQEALERETRLYGLKNASGRIEATALVIIDRTILSLTTWDIPHGPLFTDETKAEELLEDIVEEAKKDKCIALYFSPEKKLSTYNLQLTTSHRLEQPSATLLLDLTLSDEALLAQMSQKGRYNIHLAQKHGVQVEESQDIDAFYELLKKTGRRDAFRILPKSHYKQFLIDLPGSFLLLGYKTGTSKKCRYVMMSPSTEPSHRQAIVSPFDGACPECQRRAQGDTMSTFAEVSKTKNHQLTTSNLPMAGLLCVIHEQTGIYYYGASNHSHRALMAPYLLQWEAMRLCRSKGCTQYDLLGIDHPDAAMNPSTASGSWAGVTRFKKQFGGKVITYPSEQEIVLLPWAKRMIGWKRRIWG